VKLYPDGNARRIARSVGGTVAGGQLYVPIFPVVFVETPDRLKSESTGTVDLEPTEILERFRIESLLRCDENGSEPSC